MFVFHWCWSSLMTPVVYFRKLFILSDFKQTRFLLGMSYFLGYPKFKNPAPIQKFKKCEYRLPGQTSSLIRELSNLSHYLKWQKWALFRLLLQNLHQKIVNRFLFYLSVNEWSYHSFQISICKFPPGERISVDVESVIDLGEQKYMGAQKNISVSRKYLGERKIIF